MKNKALTIIPALLLASTTALATVPSGNVITLSDGSKACLPPCESSKNEITLQSGNKVCTLHVPQEIETETIVVKLDDNGREMVKAMRPESVPLGAFSLKTNSNVTKEQAEKFGRVVVTHRALSVREPDAAQPFGSTFEATDIVPLAVHGVDGDVEVGTLKLGITLKIDILETMCNNAKIRANIAVVNAESLAERTAIPYISVLAATKEQTVQFGGGMVIGGLQNIGDVESEDEFMIFMNVQEEKKDKHLGKIIENSRKK